MTLQSVGILQTIIKMKMAAIRIEMIPKAMAVRRTCTLYCGYSNCSSFIRLYIWIIMTMKSGTWNKKLSAKKEQLARLSRIKTWFVVCLWPACSIICWWCLLKWVTAIEMVVMRPMVKNWPAANLATVTSTNLYA